MGKVGRSPLFYTQGLLFELPGSQVRRGGEDFLEEVAFQGAQDILGEVRQDEGIMPDQVWRVEVLTLGRPSASRVALQ